MSVSGNVRIDCHRPEFVSFTILNFDSSFPGYPKIDYKNILKTYSKAAGEEEPIVSTPGGEEETKDSNEKSDKMKHDDEEHEELEIGGNEDPSKPALKRNRYDNIIERLERKYCGSIITETNENSDDEEEENIQTVQPLKRKKKTTNADYYDMEDPFIDDADNIATVETHLKMNKIQTKHDGYFVSSGILEIHSSDTLKPISDSQLEEAMAFIANTSPEITSKLECAFQTLKNLKTSEEINTLKKSIPQSVLAALLELDTVALSHEIDITRQISKLRSPYRIWIRSFYQTLSNLCSEDPTEEKLEGFLQAFKKQILKKRTSIGGPVEESGSTNLRQLLDQKIQDVGEKIRSKIVEISKDPANLTGSVQLSSPQATHSHLIEISEPEREEVKSDVEYQWTCKWDKTLRGHVYELEQQCRSWVDSENLLRQGSSIEKKKETSEVSGVPALIRLVLISLQVLSHHAEITKVFTQLSSIAFASPFSDTAVEKGGVLGIRKALTTEKSRFENPFLL
jgi:hypothetical protein